MILWTGKTITGLTNWLWKTLYHCFNYFPLAEVPYAQALHTTAFTMPAKKTILLLMDLEEPIQVKKTSVLFNDNEDTQVYTVSGKAEYDALDAP